MEHGDSSTPGDDDPPRRRRWSFLVIVALALGVAVGLYGWHRAANPRVAVAFSHCGEGVPGGTNPGGFDARGHVWVGATDHWWGGRVEADAKFISDNIAYVTMPDGTSVEFHRDDGWDGGRTDTYRPVACPI